MKQNQRNRYNGRYNNSNNSGRGSRPQTITRNTSLESTGPCGKLHGTALQLVEKYQTAAKDALIQNDNVLAETCLQYADHYMHVQNIAIANEQAARQQQQAQMIQHSPAQPVSEAQTETPADTQADSSAVTSEEKNVQPTDGELKVLDLSVPVADMAMKQTIQMPTHQPRRRRTATPKE